ncbi:hypothetical protein MIND_00372700 [Mycena indigotica]|uniref:CCZ1/INTU/HSP4 first Longin domain-containing protein n=1 Tax=Mycena indigotica TaxID=2126181 RepID=A0A8H6WEZ9_9AGAR|nr:uncharacterized protein MIND_00372700 [Mycena indigotica]KAF7309999.1 hypothetical protein MIND_00372700 [Mycena indigotica]
MTRIPANLQYLTIYNPTLRPTRPVAPDDEDAEEQAHILFYTSKERAVSRDRMLRQVGLAKALISFSDMFNPDEPCNNIHSQTKRLIMVSPEPDFWIHAGIETARTPKPSVDKGKSKVKDKNGAAEPPVVYDYEDYSVHDIALQVDIMRGYEKFKLRHGSFTSILSTLGQEALEVQLERFFTVWAWSWNLEDGAEFGEHLGPPLHAKHSILSQSIDDFASKLPEEVVAIAVSPPYTIPSSKYTSLGFSSALPNFLQFLVPPPEVLPSPQPLIPLDDGTVKGTKPLPPTPDDDGKSFLGMNMDMPKWGWPGYLTFGKAGASKKPPDSILAVTPMNEDKGRPQLVLDTPGLERTVSDFEVDRSALEDAMAEERLPLPAEKPEEDEETSSVSTELVPEQTPTPAPVEFLATTAHLSTIDDPHNTKRRKLFYMIRDQVLVALLWLDDSVDAQELTPATAHSFAEDTLSLALEIGTTLTQDSRSTETLPSATNTLQQKDRYALSSSNLTLRSPEFQSRSGHLYNARELLQQNDPPISEVYSRGQSPQHWHVARREELQRGLSVASEEVYMEVFRKETSLTDVDNALASVIRKSGLFP